MADKSCVEVAADTYEGSSSTLLLLIASVMVARSWASLLEGKHPGNCKIETLKTTRGGNPLRIDEARLVSSKKKRFAAGTVETTSQVEMAINAVNACLRPDSICFLSLSTKEHSACSAAQKLPIWEWVTLLLGMFH